MKTGMLALVLLMISFSGFGQDTPVVKDHRFLIETDPLPLFLGGGSLHLGWSPAKIPGFTFGLGVAGGIEYPKAFINMSDANRDDGWGVRVNQGMGMWAHYNFHDQRKGWFAGIQVFTQEMRLTNSDFPGEKDDTNTVLISVQGGYVWYLFKKSGFYLRPWGGFGYQSTVNGSFEPERVDPDLMVGDKEYKLAPFVPFATVHIGFSF